MELRIYGMNNAGSHGSSYGGPSVPIRLSAVLMPNENYGYDELHLLLGNELRTIIGPVGSDQLRTLADELRELADTMQQ